MGWPSRGRFGIKHENLVRKFGRSVSLLSDKIIFMKKLLFCILAVANSAIANSLSSKVFLGEAYPSGNVYLKPFSQRAEGPGITHLAHGLDLQVDGTHAEKPSTEQWPAKIHVSCFLKEGCADKVVPKMPQEAMRLEYLKNEVRTEPSTTPGDLTVVQYVNIPAKEGMDADHNRVCELNYPQNEKLKYADRFDFFDSQFDNCTFLDAVMQYKLNSKPKKAYQIIAFDPKIALESPVYPKRETLRPMSETEKQEISTQKKKLKGTECSSVPQFLDSAKVMVTFKVRGSDQEVRVSTFSNPGCGGHLSDAFVMDVLKQGKVQETGFLWLYRGIL